MKPTPSRRASPEPRVSSKDLLSQVRHPQAAGVDVGAEELVAAVPPVLGRPAVRSFSSFTPGVYALRDWLVECGIRTVALESTGNYWITLYAVLEEAGLEVCLVNARHAKGVPGKKTDVCDAQWLQQLHQAGLLRRSFRPTKEVAAFRYLMRHRSELIAEAARQLQRMQKVLTEMNLHLHHVFSDLDGQSAQRIVEAILAGERNPLRLAQLRDSRCRTPLAKVLEALQGDYREELLFVLRQGQQRRAQIAESIQECDGQLGRLCALVPQDEEDHGGPGAQGEQGETSATARRTAPARHKNSIGFAVAEESWRFYGVDLCSVAGVGTSTVAVLMSEVGTRAQLLEAFPTAHAFASWLGLCPDTRKTGGKVIRSKTRRVQSRLPMALRMAAQALGRSQSELGHFTRRMRGRLGKAEGITATAHKLARILYAMIRSRTPYEEEKAFSLTPAKQARKLRNLTQQARKLGMQLVPAT